jgi:hypothetical protein
MIVGPSGPVALLGVGPIGRNPGPVKPDRPRAPHPRTTRIKERDINILGAGRFGGPANREGTMIQGKEVLMRHERFDGLLEERKSRRANLILLRSAVRAGPLPAEARGERVAVLNPREGAEVLTTRELVRIEEVRQAIAVADRGDRVFRPIRRDRAHRNPGLL